MIGLTPCDTRYVDVLKLFIVAVKAGYELNLAPADVIQRVDNFPHQSAGRDLMPEEIKLRNTWIEVIYLVLEYLKHGKKVVVADGESATDAVDKDVQSKFSIDLLSEMKKQQESGDAFQLDDWLEGYSFPNMDDPMEQAIVSQSLRVIWMTYTVLEDEARCLEEKSGLKAQPPIPGAFE